MMDGSWVTIAVMMPLRYRLVYNFDVWSSVMRLSMVLGVVWLSMVL